MKEKEEQFTKVPNWLMKKKGLTDQDKLTYSILLSYVSNNKECFIGNEGLSKVLGISRNAASIRLQKLEKKGYIKLHYTYQDGKKEVDRRYITLLPIPSDIEEKSDSQDVSSEGIYLSSEGIYLSSDRRDLSSDGIEVSSDRRGGVVGQTMGGRQTDEGVSSDDGGIRQVLLDKSLDKSSDDLSNDPLHKVLDPELDEKLDKPISEIVMGGIEKQETLEGVSVSEEDIDYTSKKYDYLAELELKKLQEKFYKL